MNGKVARNGPADCISPRDTYPHVFRAGLLACLQSRLSPSRFPSGSRQRCQAYSSGGCVGIGNLYYKIAIYAIFLKNRTDFPFNPLAERPQDTRSRAV